MTGKRFQYNVNKNTIECDGKFVAYLDSVDGFRIANKLTVLAKENEQLQQQLDAFKPVMFQDMRKGTVILYRKELEE